MIDQQTAEQLIQSYCDDEPREDAVERLTALKESDLTTQTSINWVRIVDALGMEQDALDAILYGSE